MIFKSNLLFLVFTLIFTNWTTAQTQASDVKRIADENYEYLEALYKHFHARPELSLQEQNTSQRLAGELRQLGFTVTEKVGGYGIVSVFENGEGPVILVRSDMDALPIKEETNVSFASSQTRINVSGEETYVMHACGHDMHMAVMVGTARILTELRDRWNGTLVFIGQPSEENFMGATAMIEDGLFERYPVPNYMLALHVNSGLVAGNVELIPGFSHANVDLGRIVVKGRGGHGAYPDLTVDPVVLASKLVLGLQTIISREISTFDPATISVGSIHGGSNANIIPNEVVLEVSIQSHKDEVQKKLIKRISETAAAIGYAAGLPEEMWPVLELDEEKGVKAVYNNPELGDRLRRTFIQVLGEEKVEVGSTGGMYGEDFAEYGRAQPDTPAFMFRLGSVNPEEMQAYRNGARDDLPSTHSPKFLPDYKKALKTGIVAMSSAVIDLMHSN